MASLQSCTRITQRDANKQSYLDHDAFQQFLKRADIEDEPVCVISISGKARKGKSFLLNLIRCYVERRGWEDDWMGSASPPFPIDTFSAAPGRDQVTVGIRLYNRVIKLPWNGKTMALILMDTQGLFSPENTQREDRYLLTLTTLMSSVEMFNVQNNIDANELAFLQAAVEYAEKSITANGGNNYLKLQALVLIVRDEDVDDSEKYLKEILNGDKWNKEQTAVRDKMKKVFDSVHLYMLPRPKEKVTAGDYGKVISHQEIGDKFMEKVDQLLCERINPHRGLQPKVVNGGKPMTGRELLKLLACCDNFFKTSKDDLAASSTVEKIMEANVQVLYEGEFEKAFNEFSVSIEVMQSEDRDEVETLCRKAAAKALHDYEKSTSQLGGGEEGKKYRNAYRRRLTGQTDNVILATIRRVELEQRKRLEDKEENTQKKYREYAKKMQRDMKDDGENLGQLYQEIVAQIKRLPVETVNRAKLESLMDGEFQRMKQRVERRKKRNEELSDLRRSNMENLLEKQIRELENEWNKHMNTTVNVKTVIVNPQATAWQDGKMLSLSVAEMTTVSSKVKSAAMKQFWTNNLTGVEKKYNRILNEKLWKQFSSYGQSPKNKFAQETEILPDNQTPVNSSRIHDNQVNRLVQEFRNFLEEEKKSAGIGTPAKYLSIVLQLHDKYFKWCCPSLIELRQQLTTELDKKEDEMMKQRHIILAKGKVKAMVIMDLHIAILEAGLKRELATKHVDPKVLVQLYGEVSNETIIPELNKEVALGFKPTKVLEEFFKETLNQKAEQSLRRMRSLNHANLNLAVLHFLTDLINPDGQRSDDGKEQQRQPPKKRSFLQRIFGKKK